MGQDIGQFLTRTRIRNSPEIKELLKQNLKWFENPIETHIAQESYNEGSGKHQGVAISAWLWNLARKCLFLKQRARNKKSQGVS